jgi:hypothetical protein
MGHPVWPLYDLRLRTPDLELRVPTEDELVELYRVARAGVHQAGQMPFEVPWTGKPSPRLEREFMQHHWALRAQWSPNRWTLGLAVFRDGEPMGFQDVGADNFAVLREGAHRLLAGAGVPAARVRQADAGRRAAPGLR